MWRYTGVAIAAKRLLHSRPSAGVIVGRISDAAMILVAIALVIEQIIHGQPHDVIVEMEVLGGTR
jgi:hypothetical protein